MADERVQPSVAFQQLAKRRAHPSESQPGRDHLYAFKCKAAPLLLTLNICAGSSPEPPADHGKPASVDPDKPATVFQAPPPDQTATIWAAHPTKRAGGEHRFTATETPAKEYEVALIWDPVAQVSRSSVRVLAVLAEPLNSPANRPGCSNRSTRTLPSNSTARRNRPRQRPRPSRPRTSCTRTRNPSSPRQPPTRSRRSRSRTRSRLSPLLVNPIYRKKAPKGGRRPAPKLRRDPSRLAASRRCSTPCRHRRLRTILPPSRPSTPPLAPKRGGNRHRRPVRLPRRIRAETCLNASHHLAPKWKTLARSRRPPLSASARNPCRLRLCAVSPPQELRRLLLPRLDNNSRHIHRTAPTSQPRTRLDTQQQQRRRRQRRNNRHDSSVS